MRIFLSWSGERSRRIAEALKSWLPDVISFFDPWVSSEDIEKGARWELDLGNQLEATDIGLICLTPENLGAPWILFESGALAKSLGRARTCTYLFDLQPSDLTGPLVQFQATTSTKTDTFKLVRTLNKQLGKTARSPQQLERIFEQWWPSLENLLNEIPRLVAAQKNLRSEREILEELLDLVRQQFKREEHATAHPLDLLRITSFVDGLDIRRFAESIASTGPNEPNSIAWAKRLKTKSELAFLDGVWSSRWNEEFRGRTSWQNGMATIATHKQYFMLLHTDMQFEYLMLGNRDQQGRLVGRHFNLSDLRDTSPWVGYVVSSCRIDGRWNGGRWDLQRLETA